MAILLGPDSVVQTTWEQKNTIHSLASLWITFGVRSRDSSALDRVLASCGTRKGELGWWCSCYSWWLSSPSQPRACGIVERLWWLLPAPIIRLWRVLVVIPHGRFTKSNYIEIMGLEVLSWVVLTTPKCWAWRVMLISAWTTGFVLTTTWT